MFDFFLLYFTSLLLQLYRVLLPICLWINLEHLTVDSTEYGLYIYPEGLEKVIRGVNRSQSKFFVEI
jgi:hypothetical protein